MRRIALGSLAKATRDGTGRPIISVIATGPAVDKDGETMSKEFLAKWCQALDDGHVSLTPSHDTPIPLAKSIGHSRMDNGDVVGEFAVAEDDPLGMRVFGLVEAGDLSLGVSIGADQITKVGKTYTDFTPENGTVHTALCFPGRNAYPAASVLGAMVKVKSEQDPEALKKRGWPEEAIQKALVAEGTWTPPSFAERLAAWRLYDEMPELMECLTYTVEDIIDPWTEGDKRAMLDQTFSEFIAHALGAGGDATKTTEAGEEATVEKTEDEPKPAKETVEKTEETGDEETQCGCAAEKTAEEEEPIDKLRKVVEAGLAGINERIDGLEKANTSEPQEEVEEHEPEAETVQKDTDPATAPVTGTAEADEEPTTEDQVRKVLEDKRDHLRSLLDTMQKTDVKYGPIARQHSAVLAQLARI